MDNSQIASNGGGLPCISQCIDLFNKLSQAQLTEYLCEEGKELKFESCQNSSFLWMWNTYNSTLNKSYYYGLFKTALDTIIKKLSESVIVLGKKSIKLLTKEELEVYKLQISELRASVINGINRVNEIKGNQTLYDPQFTKHNYHTAFDKFIAKADKKCTFAEKCLSTKEAEFQLSALQTSALGQTILNPTPALNIPADNLATINQPNANRAIESNPLPPSVNEMPAPSRPKKILTSLENAAPSMPKIEQVVESAPSSVTAAAAGPARFDVANYVHPVFTFLPDDKNAQNMEMIEKACLKGDRSKLIINAKAAYIEARKTFVAFIQALTPNELRAWKNEWLEAILPEIGLELSAPVLQIESGGPSPAPSQAGRGGPPPPPPAPLQVGRGGPPPPPAPLGRGGSTLSKSHAKIGAKKSEQQSVPELSPVVGKRLEFMKIQSSYETAYTTLVELLIAKNEMPREKLRKAEIKMLIERTETLIITLKDKPKRTASSSKTAKSNDPTNQIVINSVLDIKKAKEKISHLDVSLNELSAKRECLNKAGQKSAKDFNAAHEGYEETKRKYASIYGSSLESLGNSPTISECFIGKKLELLKQLSKLIEFNVDEEIEGCRLNLNMLVEQRGDALKQKELADRCLAQLAIITLKLVEASDLRIEGLNDGTIIPKSPSLLSFKRPVSKIVHSNSSPNLSSLSHTPPQLSRIRKPASAPKPELPVQGEAIAPSTAPSVNAATRTPPPSRPLPKAPVNSVLNPTEPK